MALAGRVRKGQVEDAAVAAAAEEEEAKEEKLKRGVDSRPGHRAPGGQGAQEPGLPNVLLGQPAQATLVDERGKAQDRGTQSLPDVGVGVLGSVPGGQE